MTYYIGIDIGFTGALAVVDRKKRIVALEDAPVVEVPYGKKTRVEFDAPRQRDILRNLRMAKLAVMEDVGARPGQGVTSMYRFGHGQGLWEGILTTLEIPYVKVLPVTWKQYFGFLKQDKEASLAYVREQYPDEDYFRLKKHHNRAEAVCLALYGMDFNKE